MVFNQGKKEEMERPSIVFSVNNGFISYLIVALRTLGRNNDYPIDIYIIHSDLSIENLNLLEKICFSFNYKLESIYGKNFPDESYSISHNKPGILSMVNNGPDTNNT